MPIRLLFQGGNNTPEDSSNLQPREHYVDYKKRFKTGLKGLDHILGGGLPERHIYLLEGEPGSDKTTMAMQFLMKGKRNKERCLYIGFSESKTEILNVAKTHDWDLEGIELFEIMAKDKLSSESQNTFFHTAEVELGATSQIIIDEVTRAKPQRVVIDSLTELKLLAQDPMKFRRQILMLKQFFQEQDATVLLLDDKTSSISDQEVKSIVHGIIKLEQLSPEYGAERRRLRVLKLRGVAFRGGYHDFKIQHGGVVIFTAPGRLGSSRDCKGQAGEERSLRYRQIDGRGVWTAARRLYLWGPRVQENLPSPSSIFRKRPSAGKSPRSSPSTKACALW